MKTQRHLSSLNAICVQLALLQLFFLAYVETDILLCQKCVDKSDYIDMDDIFFYQIHPRFLTNALFLQ